MYRLYHYYQSNGETVELHCEDNTLEQLQENYIDSWKIADYTLSALSGIKLVNLETEVEYIHMFKEPNDWDGFDLSVFFPKPMIKEKSTLEI